VDDVLARLAAATKAALRVEGVGEGTGTVAPSRDGDTWVLTAAGTWAPDGRPVRWRAVSRWRVEGAALSVAWVRPGAWARAVLDDHGGGVWVGRTPHVCGADRYAASLRLGPDVVEVAWAIRGPAKASRVVTRFG